MAFVVSYHCYKNKKVEGGTCTLQGCVHIWEIILDYGGGPKTIPQVL